MYIFFRENFLINHVSPYNFIFKIENIKVNIDLQNINKFKNLNFICKI